MARINGINSDYAMIDGAIAKVEPNPANLELKLFLCPYEQPNGLEAESGTCSGINTACPHPDPILPPNPLRAQGHALLHLSQDDGIKLLTDDGTLIQLHQNSGDYPGQIVLHPAGTKVRVESALELVAGGHTLTITPSAAGITLLHTNGASVVFKPNGDLDLITKNNVGTVNIQGNLVVSGTLTRQGQQL